MSNKILEGKNISYRESVRVAFLSAFQELCRVVALGDK